MDFPLELMQIGKVIKFKLFGYDSQIGVIINVYPHDFVADHIARTKYEIEMIHMSGGKLSYKSNRSSYLIWNTWQYVYVNEL